MNPIDALLGSTRCLVFNKFRGFFLNFWIIFPAVDFELFSVNEEGKIPIQKSVIRSPTSLIRKGGGDKIALIPVLKIA